MPRTPPTFRDVFPRVGYTRRRVRITGRFGEDDAPETLFTEDKVRCYGFLAVHSSRTKVVPGPGETRLLRFLPAKTKSAQWVITNLSTGMSVSRGSDRWGYRRVGLAYTVAEKLNYEFYEMLLGGHSQPTPDAAVEYFKNHEQWADFAAMRDALEEKYTFMSA